jgi:hypothetical protein
LGSMHHNADRKDEGAWEPQDPALSYLRQAITEYCVLPMGSEDIRAAMDPDKVCIYYVYICICIYIYIYIHPL